jgi:hypothetical protein
MGQEFVQYLIGGDECGLRQLLADLNGFLVPLTLAMSSSGTLFIIVTNRYQAGVASVAGSACGSAAPSSPPSGWVVRPERSEGRDVTVGCH